MAVISTTQDKRRGALAGAAGAPVGGIVVMLAVLGLPPVGVGLAAAVLVGLVATGSLLLARRDRSRQGASGAEWPEAWADTVPAPRSFAGARRPTPPAPRSHPVTRAG